MTIFGRLGAGGRRGTGGTALMRMERTSGRSESESESESESDSPDSSESESEESGESDESGRDSYTPSPRFCLAVSCKRRYETERTISMYSWAKGSRCSMSRLEGSDWACCSSCWVDCCMAGRKACSRCITANG